MENKDEIRDLKAEIYRLLEVNKFWRERAGATASAISEVARENEALLAEIGRLRTSIELRHEASRIQAANSEAA